MRLAKIIAIPRAPERRGNVDGILTPALNRRRRSERHPHVGLVSLSDEARRLGEAEVWSRVGGLDDVDRRDVVRTLPLEGERDRQRGPIFIVPRRPDVVRK
jgi:hypothetical protein